MDSVARSTPDRTFSPMVAAAWVGGCSPISAAVRDVVELMGISCEPDVGPDGPPARDEELAPDELDCGCMLRPPYSVSSTTAKKSLARSKAWGNSRASQP